MSNIKIGDFVKMVDNPPHHAGWGSKKEMQIYFKRFKDKKLNKVIRIEKRDIPTKFVGHGWKIYFRDGAEDYYFFSDILRKAKKKIG